MAKSTRVTAKVKRVSVRGKASGKSKSARTISPGARFDTPGPGARFDTPGPGARFDTPGPGRARVKTNIKK